MESKIREGEEYQIVRLPGDRVLFTGIAESDTDAEETLEQYAMHVRAVLNVTHAVTLKLERLS